MPPAPARFSPRELGRLRAFLDALPRDFAYAVELRHAAFFAGGPEEEDAVELMRERGVDLVMMDTRGIHASHSLQFAEVRARKPLLPVVMRATAQRPIVRCVPHEDWDATLPFVQAWPPQLARWIAQGKRPYFFMHSPDDVEAPRNAYHFHALLRAHADVGDLPPWPGAPRQLGLF